VQVACSLAEQIALLARLIAVAREDPALDLSGEQAGVVIQPPPGYLSVAGLDEVSSQDLAARRGWLLAALAVAGPGRDHPAVQGAALALAAVLCELGARTRNHAADPDSPRWCKCGFRCHGLTAIDDHLDRYPDLDDDAHHEMASPPGDDARRRLLGQAARDERAAW